ncbi:DNA-binding NarL/FixJ family response regulator [Granulicella aggregans]|uniref:DNA-binding NarL/FixJ family response regulator n=1 Tax=Granulicella aggregans TaxID=474949 RepID=A0A7W7ZGZ2_9BACT|nr:DNA-binding NarL/FixJ family response regulator [Granulicella aggregans]
MHTATLKVLIVDDHPMVREGLAGIFARYNISVTGLASNGQSAIEMFRAERPDVVLLDLRLPDQSGIEVLRALLAIDPQTRVVMLTSAQGDASVYEAISAGACGYLLKGIEGGALAEQLRRVAAGGKALPAETTEKLATYIGSRKLSEREVEVLTLISRGKSNKEAAQLLFITEDTVKMHVKNILQKLQASDRTQAVVIALQRGFLNL